MNPATTETLGAVRPRDVGEGLVLSRCWEACGTILWCPPGGSVLLGTRALAQACRLGFSDSNQPRRENVGREYRLRVKGG